MRSDRVDITFKRDTPSHYLSITVEATGFADHSPRSLTNVQYRSYNGGLVGLDARCAHLNLVV